MVVANHAEKLLVYATWYGFKRDLERHLGYSLLNREWLRLKPQAPLPWESSHMEAALRRASRVAQRPGERSAVRPAAHGLLAALKAVDSSQ